MPNIEITKSTGITISVALLLALVGSAYAVGSRVTSIESKVERNTSDISSILNKMDVLNENLAKTNGSIIELNARLDNLTGQINKLTVSRQTPQPFIRVTSSSGRTQPSAPSPPRNDSGGESVFTFLQRAALPPCTLLKIACS